MRTEAVHAMPEVGNGGTAQLLRPAARHVVHVGPLLGSWMG
jgi:hypothetical protein